MFNKYKKRKEYSLGLIDLCLTLILQNPKSPQAEEKPKRSLSLRVKSLSGRKGITKEMTAKLGGSREEAKIKVLKRIKKLKLVRSDRKG